MDVDIVTSAIRRLLHVLQGAALLEMRLASSHGASSRVIKSTWLHPRHTSYFATAGLNPITRKSFEKLQLELDEEPYVPRGEVNPNAKSIAVLGGGISGLATAFELSRIVPGAKITIYETAKKLGGWIDSEIIPVDDGEVVFEWGPRTLRHTSDGSGVAMVNLMAHLGMGPHIVATSTLSPAARNRYIYYPDHLVRMPGPVPGVGVLRNLFNNFSSLFTEPIFKGTFSGLLAEPSVDPRPSYLEDESVGAFITRRFGKPVAENLVSAFLHGIYAGNLHKLSARTLFPQLWHLETMDTGIVGSLFDNMWNGRSLVSYEQLNFLVQMSRQSSPTVQQMRDILRPLTGSSVYTFKRGLSQLIAILESTLRQSSNVVIRTKTVADSMRFDRETKTISLRTNPSSGEQVDHHDYVISTIPPTALCSVLASPKHVKATGRVPAELISALSETAPSSVNVMVVNLFYSDPTLLPYRGFGYLLPRSVPLEQNPERALGVIFGSETSISDQHVFDQLGFKMGGDKGPPKPEDIAKAIALAEEEAKATPRPRQDTVRGTKLTVMMGGHWWEGWHVDTDLPDEESAIQMARSVLKRHLGITDMPIVAKARLARNAIPQYQIGYHRAMGIVHEKLLEEFGGRLKVAGPAFQGAVGVNDCVKAAMSLALGLKEGWDGDGRTGLESFQDEGGARLGRERWVVVDKSGEVLRESFRGKQD